MSPGVRNSVLGCVAFVAVVLGTFVFNVTRDHPLSDAQLRELGAVVLPRPRELADFSLTFESGETFDLAALRGKWSLLYFGFTYCPDICPTTLAELAKAKPFIEEQFAAHGTDAPLQLVLVSVDPERDTPEQLKNYVSFFDAAMRGATGDRERLVTLSQQVSVPFAKVPGTEPGTYTLDHGANIVVINPQGHYVGFIKPPISADNLKTVVPQIARAG